MADLSDDRGQILLIGALAIAVAFVALALVLNSSVYIENIANRENVVVGEGGVVVYQNDVRRGVGRAVVAGNANGTTFADRRDDVEEGVGTLGAALGGYHAERGRAVNVSVVGHSEGTRVFRSTDGEFTEPNGTDGNWTLVANDRFRRFDMTVERSDLSTGVLSEVFWLRIQDDDGDVWKVKVTRDVSTTETRVQTIPPSGPASATCIDTTGSTTNINVTAATVAGEHCEGLDFFESTDPPYTVAYRNAYPGNVTGRYGFVVDDPSPAPDYAGDGGITTQAVVYDTTVEAVYYAPDVRYVVDLRVAPGEPDA